jgi:hypothetical protein
MSGASRASGNRLLTYRSLTPSAVESSATLLTAPIGVWTASPSRPADHGHQSDFGLAPMPLGDQEHVEIRPKGTADVGK